MAIDYIAEDEALDKELEAIYADTLNETDSSSEKEKDSPTELAADSTEQEEAKQENESQSVEGEAIAQDQPTVPMVEETRYKEAVRAMNQAQRELAEYRKQSANYDNQIAALQQQVNDLLDKQTSAPNESTIDDDAFNDAKEIYPEVINPLLKLIDGLKQELGQVKNEVGQVKTVTNHYQQSEQDQETQRYWDTIKSYYPNVDDIAESPDYAEWYDSQSPGIQKLLTSQNAYDVINGLRFYQQATQPAEQAASPPVPSPSQPKIDKLAAAKAAAAPNIKSANKPEQKTKFTLAQIEKMSNAEFAKYEAEIDEAMAAGEIY